MRFRLLGSLYKYGRGYQREASSGIGNSSGLCRLGARIRYAWCANLLVLVRESRVSARIFGARILGARIRRGSARIRPPWCSNPVFRIVRESVSNPAVAPDVMMFACHV